MNGGFNMNKNINVCISKGNSKMGAIPSVSLPPIKSCSPEACKHCGKKCYALRMARFHKSVGDSYNRNLDILLKNPGQYWREVEAAIMGNRFFRFHVAGDIWNYDYFVKVCEIAKRNKHCKILMFTKKYDIVNKYLETKKIPSNLIVIFSAWQGMTTNNINNLPESHVIYRDGTTTAKDGAIYCSGNCFECAINNGGCWSLKKGQQVIFKEH